MKNKTSYHRKQNFRNKRLQKYFKNHFPFPVLNALILDNAKWYMNVLLKLQSPIYLIL